ncbi:MAG: exodeoxyribonuclease III [Blastocatellia bacterium]|nr:exodeoxyribonuclease III [Blastocatellia bacterium]
MKIATWNVNSVTARLPVVSKWLEAERPDVLCMQETKCIDDKFPREAFLELGYSSETFGQPTYNGVAIVSLAECSEVLRGFPEDEPEAQARMLAAKIEGVRIINVYIPNGGEVGIDKYYFKLDWMKRLRSFLDSYAGADEMVLLCGDFNVAPEDRDVHDPALWEGHVHVSEPERAALEEIKAWGLVDAFRLHIEEDKHYSWWDYRAGAFRRNAGLRIDHIWVSKALAVRCRAAWIDKEPRRWERPSDHTPVVAEFD